MFYIVHRGRVLSAANEFTPHAHSRWQPGQIVHFATAAEALPEDLEDAFLMDRQGSAWHVEILAVAEPGESPGLPHASGVTVRLLRQLRAEVTVLEKVRQHAARVAPFRARPAPVLEHQGAA